MGFQRAYILILLIAINLSSFAQDRDSALQNASQIPAKYYSTVNKKISGINEQLTKKALKYLAKFQRQEQKLQQRLQKLHPELALNNAADKYNEFSQKIKNKTSGIAKVVGGEYSPYMDSLGTSLSFLKQFNGVSDKVKNPLENFDLLQGNFQESEKIKAFIAQRKNELKDILSKYTHLPPGLKKEYDQLSKTAYYYSAQVQEYKDMMKDPKKIEQKALVILNKLPAFQKFMKENSQVASLFRIPSNYGTTQNLTGLQTRSSVQALIQQRIAAGGPNAQSQIQQNLAQAQAELNEVKDKFSQLMGQGGADPEMPNFKPNSQKTKTLLRRLEYGFNVQFAKSSSLLPSTANLALTVGYKLNDKSSLGVGASYNIGMGTIRHISISSQGLGLRSYLDWKIKKQFYASGGYELNYNSAFNNIEQLKNYAAWQRSGLIGISKKYPITKKTKGEMKLLYDFLAAKHIPVTSPILFRIGYSF
ncbi:hypothetical protein FW778_08550 [Ginsengibacter hankyongi]|uniref:Uncharacterized protein n=1 Tax=Ginsengibacter hankyongi TaxID=2607284 RepID=A0A5J5IMV0_9BACT|nr:hypothetical protein [Ginsengibacter hankyongi]KAA9042051.1 hypothetical protein FW778_08550 [Ginsengibacter hankyongi]